MHSSDPVLWRQKSETHWGFRACWENMMPRFEDTLLQRNRQSIIGKTTWHIMTTCAFCCPVMSEKHCFFKSSATLITFSPLLLHKSLRLEGKWYRHLILEWALQCLLFSAYWTVVNVCVNYHLLWEDISLMRIEKYKSLGVILCSLIK